MFVLLSRSNNTPPYPGGIGSTITRFFTVKERKVSNTLACAEKKVPRLQHLKIYYC